MRKEWDRRGARKGNSDGQREVAESERVHPFEPRCVCILCKIDHSWRIVGLCPTNSR